MCWVVCCTARRGARGDGASPGHSAGRPATPGFEGCQAVPRLGNQQTFFARLSGEAPRAPHRQQGQGPGGRGGGRKRRPAGHRRDRAAQAGGETHPARGLTSPWSRRMRRRKGQGRDGPPGRAAPGTARPWRSAPGWVPERVDHRGTARPTPARSERPRGQGAAPDARPSPAHTAPTP